MKQIDKSCGGTFVFDAQGKLLEHRAPTRPAGSAPVAPAAVTEQAPAASQYQPSTLFHRGTKRRSHPQE